MLNGELLESLSPCQCGLNSGRPTSEVVLGLVEDRLGLEDLEDSLISFQDLPGEHKIGQLVDVEVGFSSLLFEELGALGTRGFEGLDPFWIGGHVGGLRRRRNLLDQSVEGQQDRLRGLRRAMQPRGEDARAKYIIRVRHGCG